MNKNVTVTFIVNFVNSLSVTIVIPVVYEYALTFGMSDLEASMLLTIYFVFQFIATPIIGRLSDNYGRKPLLIISLIGTAIANLTVGLANTPLYLFMARAADGATGGNVSVAQAVVTDSLPAEKRGKGFALLGASFGVAFIFGPLISRVALDYSLRLPFYIASFLAVIATLITFIFLDETRVKRTKATNAIKKRWSIFSTFHYLTKKRIGSLLFVSFLLHLGQYIFTIAFQPFVIYVYGWDSQDIADILILFGFFAFLVQAFIVRNLVDKYDDKNILGFSTIFGGAVLGLFAVAYKPWIFIVAVALYSFATSFVRPSVTAMISLNSEEDEYGEAIGVHEGLISLASAIGPAIGGIILTYPETFGLWHSKIIEFANLMDDGGGVWDSISSVLLENADILLTMVDYLSELNIRTEAMPFVSAAGLYVVALLMFWLTSYRYRSV